MEQSYIRLFFRKNFLKNSVDKLKYYIFLLNNLKIGSYIRYDRKIWLYKKAHIKLHRSCRLKIAKKNSLRLGTPWDPLENNFYPVYFDTHFVAYKNTTIEIAGNVIINTGCLFRIQENGKLIIGKNVGINYSGMIYCYEMIKIGNGVIIGPYVRIRDSDSHHLKYSGYDKKVTAPIIIEDNVWIGMGVTILKGVTIGEGCVVATGAVVTKSFPPGCLIGGNPAKVIRENVSWH